MVMTNSTQPQEKSLKDLLNTGVPKASTVQAQAPSLPSFDSQVGQLLGVYEGLRTDAYKDTEGIPTIGIGATYYPPGFRLQGKVKMGDKISKDEAIAIKKQHIEEHRQRLLKDLPAETYAKVPDNVKAALESKVFNYGSLGSTLANLVTEAVDTGDYTPVSDYFRNTLSKHNDGVNAWRRKDEADLIDTGESPRAKQHKKDVLFSKGATFDPRADEAAETDEPAESEAPSQTSVTPEEQPKLVASLAGKMPGRDSQSGFLPFDEEEMDEEEEEEDEDEEDLESYLA